MKSLVALVVFAVLLVCLAAPADAHFRFRRPPVQVNVNQAPAPQFRAPHAAPRARVNAPGVQVNVR
jgi:hypothetical protein